MPRHTGVPLAPPLPLWHNEGDCWDLLGVRHGRVLIFNRTRHEFLVWDPATGDRRCVAALPEFNVKGKFVCNGAVLCAAGEQGHAQHGQCHSGPFQLVLIGIGQDERRAFACVYSSQTREWGNPSSTALRYGDDIVDSASTLIGDSLYWLLPPEMDTNCSNYQIILAEGGGLGIAALRSFSFDMWERKVGNDGVASWMPWKTVKLEEITGLSRDVRGHMIIHGYDEEDNVIFLRTDVGCFIVELESMKFRNLGKWNFITTCAYHPYRSLYTSKGRFMSLSSYFKRSMNPDRIVEYLHSSTDVFAITS